MKIYFVCAFICFALISTNASFLRNLATEITIKSYDFGGDCSLTGLPTDLTVNAESATAVTNLKVTLSPTGDSGTTSNLVFTCSVPAKTRLLAEISCDGDPDACDEIDNTKCEGGKCVCVDNTYSMNADGSCQKKQTVDDVTDEDSCKAGEKPKTPKYGNYTVTASSEGNTINDSGVTGAYFRYDANVAIGTAQTTSQTVNSESSDKKSFTVAFDTAVETALPRFYAEEKSETEIPCTLSSDKKTATCTPTSAHMKDGETYTIYYRTNCAKKGTTTGIQVEYESSAYAKLGSVLLIALGVFLL